MMVYSWVRSCVASDVAYIYLDALIPWREARLGTVGRVHFVIFFVFSSLCGVGVYGSWVYAHAYVQFIFCLVAGVNERVY